MTDGEQTRLRPCCPHCAHSEALFTHHQMRCVECEPMPWPVKAAEGREQSQPCRCDHDHADGRVPSRCPNCADCLPGRERACVCGHDRAHHTGRGSVYAGLMADYRVVWRCAWEGCGCPEYVKAKR